MKKKRSKRRIKHRAALQSQTPSRPTTTVSQMPKRMVSTGLAGPDFPSIQRDKYKYVLADLRWIGVIAMSLFLILIVLSFVLG